MTPQQPWKWIPLDVPSGNTTARTWKRLSASRCSRLPTAPPWKGSSAQDGTASAARTRASMAGRMASARSRSEARRGSARAVSTAATRVSSAGVTAGSLPLRSGAVLDRRVTLNPVLPTPVEPLDRLGAALGLAAGRLWVKRDDLTGLAGGGNKVRKLEYLCADALARGCDTLVTGGGRQSNHVRMTAAAANHLGLACTIVLGSEPPDEATGNVLLDQLLGPDIVWAGPLDYYDL